MKAVAMDTADDSTSQASEDQLVTLQIYVPELVVQKCMQFNKEEVIWDVKNQILTSLPKELKEGFNYGLFCPPVNGRAGKFLDEERPLADYPFAESTGYVELRYKRRIYKMSMEEKQLRQIHSRANLRRLLEHVHNNHVDKITKMCSRGLDPNFHCSESGESPLTLSTSLKHPAKVIMALVNGGAHLDFRTKDGCTVLHKAVEKNNLEALRTLLDLGSSPNYKDSRGLTTLYYSVLHNSDPQLTEMLLHDHAMIGTSDPHGWQEIHQACKYGLVQHLEHLLFYGADMNARNASGNTPLHVCAVNDQESCARVLLFRGADKGALNYANQNPHQVAVIAGNLRLAEIIKNHREEDVVPYREAPRYNPRRRTSTANMGTLSHNHSDPRLEITHSGKPPSPCPSNHSLPHLSTTSDSVSHATEEDSEEGSQQNTSLTDVGESSGAGANSSGTDSDPFDSAKSTPLLESVCVCIEDYTPSTSGHLQLCKGDIVEVIGVSGSGYLEGRRRDGDEGLFPAICVHEMPLKVSSDTLPPGGKFRTERRNMNFKTGDVPRKWKMFGEPRTVVLHKGKKGFGFILRGAKATSPLMERQPTEFWPSLQYLDDVDKGGVAEMAGLKKGDFLLEINGQDVSQASHEHVVAIIRQSGDLVSMTVVTVLQQPQMTLTPTEKPQLINRQCATLPRKLSTKKAPLPPKRDPKTTLSVGRARARSMVAGLAEIEVLDHTLNEYDSEGRSTKSSSIESIPNKPGSSATPESTPSTTTTTPVATTTTTPTSSQMPSTLLSRPSSRKVSVSELEDFFARHLSATDHPRGYIRNRFATKARIHRCPKKPSKRSKGAQLVDSDLRTPKNYSSTPELTLDLHACEEFDIYNEAILKRSRSFGDVHFPLSRYTMRHPGAYHSQNHVRAVSERDHHKHHHHRHERPLLRQHSIPETTKPSHQGDRKIRERSATPELTAPSVIKQNGSDIYAETVPVNVKPLDKTVVPGRASCPPPSYPPPPPPVGQMIKVDVSRTSGEYANSTVGRQHHKPTAIMSSFRPTDSAKLYASPDAFTPVGYKKDHLQKCDVTLPRHMAKSTGLRSQSLPPKMPAGAKGVSNAAQAGGRSTASLDADNSSGDSATGYVPYKTAHRSRDQIAAESGMQIERAGGTLRKVKTSKLHAATPDSASPKHYPPMAQHAHEHFIPEPDYESSEEEDRSSIMDTKGGLVTFKALESQNGNQETSQEIRERRKVAKQKSDASVNSEQLSTDQNIRALRHQTSLELTDSKISGVQEKIPILQETSKSDDTPHRNDIAKTESAVSKDSDGDLSQISENAVQRKDVKVPITTEKDMKVPITTEKAPDDDADGEAAVTSGLNRNQTKPQKIAPVPPPKRVEENALPKVVESDASSEDRDEIRKESPEKADRDSQGKLILEKETSQKERHELKSKTKESVPFKATIILKQTEIISKEKQIKSRNKELIHQHSAHELVQDSEKSSTKSKEDIRDVANKDVHAKEKCTQSPSQAHKDSLKDARPVSRAQEESQMKESFREYFKSAEGGSPKEKPDASAQKIAPAVPKKPKVDDVKQVEEISDISETTKLPTSDSSNGEQEVPTTGVDSVSRSVKENIYNFEKRSELAAKTTFSPRRKSDVIRITLVGSQHKTTENKQEERVNLIQTMKTSKSCPKTFEEDSDSGENGSGIITSAGSYDPETQVTRFSAETPTTSGPVGTFSEEWKRSEICAPAPLSPLIATTENAKKPPDTPPKTTIMRRVENFNRQSTLGRRPSSGVKETENGDLESPVFTGSMTLNRQSFTKSNQFSTTALPASTESSRKIATEHMMSSASEASRKMASELISHATDHTRKKGVEQYPLTSSAECMRKTNAELMTPTTDHTRKIATEHMMISSADVSRKIPSEYVITSTIDYPRKIATEQMMMSSVDSSRKVVADLMTPTSETTRKMVNDLIMTSSAEHAPRLSTSHVVSAVADHTHKISMEHPMSSTVEHARKFAAEQIANAVRMRDFEESSYPEIIPSRASGPLSAQARLLDNRQIRVSPPTNRVPLPKAEDDECLRLCQRVDKSLQLIRLQVDSLGMAAASEPETLAELVPPPPEFNFAPPVVPVGNHPPPNMGSMHIAPPPEFSDETLARQRRHHQQQAHALNALPQATRMVAPPSTIDMPVSRRVVPPDGSSYPYSDHPYRAGYVQSPDSHPHLIPNNMSSSPVKTMTISRGYPSHHFMHQPIRYDSNCSTLPHPARMAAGHVRMEHPFSPGRTTRDVVPQRMMGPMQPPQQSHKEFRQKPLHQWSGKDVADWLESLFLPEYKICFAEAGITGSKLANMDNNDLMGLGVKQSGHRLNMERSIKWYLK